MVKVGLIGYFGSGAYSDDLIEHVTKKLLLEARPDLIFDSTLLSRGEAASNPDYLNSFDLLIHCGGSLLGKCTHPPVRDIARWAGKLRVPLCVFGIGYRFEPDKEPLAPEMRERIRLLFEKSSVVSVRGKYTVKHLQENGIDTSKICSLADPVTACSAEPRSPAYIVGNVRDMPPIEVQHSTTGSVHRFMAECYDWLIDAHDLPLLLVSWRHNIDSDNDVKGADKVISLMKNKRRANRAAPPNYLVAASLINGAEFCYGQRLHPTVYAATQGVPFVGVEYQFDKMFDWASTVGIDNVIHTGTSDLNSFINAHERVEANMAKLRETLPLKVAEIKATAKKIVELV